MIRRLIRLLLPASARAAIRRGGLRLRYAGWNRWCPTCRSWLRRFLPFGPKLDAICPVCESLDRHRLQWLYCQEKLADARPRRVLHMAPDDGIARRLSVQRGVDYVSADPCNPRAMLNFDLAHTPFDDETFDVILISHVLQHTWDDHRALSELHRILKPDGWMLMSEVFRDGPTVEHAIAPEQRKAIHGYHDATFVRHYGTDFAERLRSHGLLAALVPFVEQFDAAQRRRMGLSGHKHFYIVTKMPTVSASS